MNLAVNARDAMPNGGMLTIAARDVSASERPALPKDLPGGDYVRISVADTGHRDDEATQARMRWSRFLRPRASARVRGWVFRWSMV